MTCQFFSVSMHSKCAWPFALPEGSSFTSGMLDSQNNALPSPFSPAATEGSTEAAQSMYQKGYSY